jgi:protein Mpv17
MIYYLAVWLTAMSLTTSFPLSGHPTFGAKIQTRVQQRIRLRHLTPDLSAFLTTSRLQQRWGHRNTSTSLYFSQAVLGVLNGFCKSYPYASAALVCALKGSAADYVAQKRASMKAVEEAEEKIHNVDTPTAETVAAATSKPLLEPARTSKTRNFTYIIYSALYQGMFQEFMCNTLMPAMFGSGTDVITVLCKVCFDLTFQAILLTLPAAYLSKALIFQFSVKEAYGRYMYDIKNNGLLTKYFLLWGPVQCITYSVIPKHLRVSFIASVSFVWLIILSSIAGKQKPKKKSKNLDSSTMAAAQDIEGGPPVEASP